MKLELLTLDEVAATLRRSRSWCYELIREKHLIPIRFADNKRAPMLFKASDIEAFVERHIVKGDDGNE